MIFQRRRGSAATERISVDEFHSINSKLFSSQCVEKLRATNKYKRYYRFRDHYNQLYMLWFLMIPLLSVVSCYWYFVIAAPAQLEESFLQSKLSGSPWIEGVTFFVVFYLAPGCSLLNFVGRFEDLSRCDVFCQYIFLCVVHFSLSIMNRSPSIEGIEATLKVSWSSALWDVASCQGYTLASFAVGMWRTLFWERVVHIPAPTLSIPLLVGCIGLLVTNISTSYFKLVEDTEETQEIYVAMQHFIHPGVENGYFDIVFFRNPQTLFCSIIFSLTFFTAAILRPMCIWAATSLLNLFFF